MCYNWYGGCIMAYYLTVEDRKGNYKFLDISFLEEFKKSSVFIEGYSLGELDDFTSQFEDEVALKEKLYGEGLITLENITEDLFISMKYKGNYVKLKNGIVYESVSRYIDYSYLYHKLLGLKDDKVFLRTLVAFYHNDHNREGLNKIRAVESGYSDGDIDIGEALTSFFEKKVYRYDNKSGKRVLRYRELHDFGIFIYDYLSLKSKSIEQRQREINCQYARLVGLRDSLTPVSSGRRVRSLKQREEIEGQFSLFKILK